MKVRASESHTEKQPNPTHNYSTTPVSAQIVPLGTHFILVAMVMHDEPGTASSLIKDYINKLIIIK